MFDTKYYKKKFVYRCDDKLVLLDFNINNAIMYLVDNSNPNRISLGIKPVMYNELTEDRLIPLSVFLIEHGFSDSNFSDKLTRTKKIIFVIDEINKSLENKKSKL